MIASIQETTRWEIDRTLATGGLGTVYLARQIGAEGFEKRVALKVLKENAAKDPLFRRQLADEARLCANLVHENIVQIYQLLLHDGHYQVVMELVEGVSLRQFCERHKLRNEQVPIDLAAFVASRVCRALHYAHTRTDPKGHPLGIVHRDVCPNNILISLGGVVKLGDFGIAKANMTPHEEGTILQGKARYMSPEQASYQVTDPRTDLFSLGTVLWETITGQPLFLGDSTEETMSFVQHKAVPTIDIFRPDALEQLKHIVGWALERDPTRRVPDASTFGYQLEYFLYHDGFGPTNDRLREHLEDLFPELYQDLRQAAASDVSADGTVRLPAPAPAPTARPSAPAGADSVKAITRELPISRPEALLRKPPPDPTIDKTDRFPPPFARPAEPPRDGAD